MKFVPIFLSIDRIIESLIKSMQSDNLLFKSGVMMKVVIIFLSIYRIMASPIKSMQSDYLVTRVES